MRLTVDTVKATITVEDDGISQVLSLYSDDAFRLLSDQWLQVGWNQKYSYRFTWLGRPVIQIPDDLIRIQEAIWETRPDVILETGVAHGGSLVFHASVCRLLEKGRVIGVDREVRSHNRRAIESHPLASLITLIEGDSVEASTLEVVRSCIEKHESVMVILDSSHTYAHVRAELEAYGPLVGVGHYLLVADGIMRALSTVPRGVRSWKLDNPHQALEDFLATHSDFQIVPHPGPFNESGLDWDVTYMTPGWVKRIRAADSPEQSP